LLNRAEAELWSVARLRSEAVSHRKSRRSRGATQPIRQLESLGARVAACRNSLSDRDLSQIQRESLARMQDAVELIRQEAEELTQLLHAAQTRETDIRELCDRLPRKLRNRSAG
jgi:hypothetical protein